MEYVGGFHVSDLTPAICMRIVQSNGKNFLRIPAEMQTPELATAAIKSAPKLIKEISPRLIASEAYRFAIMKDPSLAKFVPNALRSYQDYLALWKVNDTTLAMLISNTPTDKLPEIYEEISNHNPAMIAQIPEHYRTRSICISAINAGVEDVFRYIPDSQRTTEIYTLLIDKFMIGLQHIPREYLTERTIIKYISHRSEYFKQVPADLVTNNIVMCYVRYSHSLTYVPAKFLTRDIYVLYSMYGNILDIPVEYWTEEMILRAASRRGWNRIPLKFAQIPARFQTDLVKCMYDIY